MESDKRLIKDIDEIRSQTNFRTISFLKLLLDLKLKEGKKLLDKIQNGDQRVQILSDMLHMKTGKTDLEILNQIEKIRAENNTLWMDVVRMCFELDKKRARMIFSEIKECDRKIQKLTKKISRNE